MAMTVAQRRAALAAATRRRLLAQRASVAKAAAAKAAAARAAQQRAAAAKAAAARAAAARAAAAKKPNPGLPYDEELAAEERELGFERANTLADFLERENATNTAYTQGRRNLDLEMPNAYRGLLNNFGSRGMARSTGYAGARQEAESDFARRGSDLMSARTSDLANVASQRGRYEGQYRARLADIIRRRAQRSVQSSFPRT